MYRPLCAYYDLAQKFEWNQNFIEAFTAKTDFDGNFIKKLLNKVVEGILY